MLNNENNLIKFQIIMQNPKLLFKIERRLHDEAKWGVGCLRGRVSDSESDGRGFETYPCGMLSKTY